jgi:Flp pilus assembly protein TadD
MKQGRSGSSSKRLTVAERYYERGLDQYAKGTLDMALEDMDEAIQNDPRNAELYVARGLMLFQQGWADDAEDDLVQGLKLDPTQWLAHYVRGMRAFKAGDHLQAVNHFSRAQRVAPERAEIYFHRAVVFHQMSNTEEAIRDMEFAQSLLESKDKRREQAQQWLTIFRNALPSSAIS